ncbi:MAG: hypothetical protein RSE13_16335 [Planktothrix sp. GU0601_MAG3]|nr:MAG: hypothetical protein RSE13_16335 [Planktothrix sp. GU0601_MAG3]
MSVTPIQPPTIDLTEVITEDDTPVDNFLSAKLQRLLVECLYSFLAKIRRKFNIFS